MKHIVFLLTILTAATTFAQNTSWTASYKLKADICYNNQTPTACDPQYRTVVQQMDLVWTARKNPLMGSTYATEKQVIPSVYADDLTPIGVYSNFGSAVTDAQINI